MMKLNRILMVLLAVTVLGGCSTLGRMFPDRSGEYRQAEAMPDLEIPPDLTRSAINDRMSIPGESARTGQAPAREVAEELALIQTVSGKALLSIPGEFTASWGRVESILVNLGAEIRNSDQNNGTFDISYRPGAGDQESRGFFSRLAFWKRESSADYRVSLTGVGNKTEVVLLDDQGEWLATAEADQLLGAIRDQYNLTGK